MNAGKTATDKSRISPSSSTWTPGTNWPNCAGSTFPRGVQSSLKRLQMDTWEKDGVRHQKLKVRASTIKFLPQGDRLNGGAPRQTAAESELGAAIAAPGAPAEPLENDPDNLPF